jgi:fumarate reductase subunit D
MGRLQRFGLIGAPSAQLVAQRAARLQRHSGLALAVFLPLHFWLLAQSLKGSGALDYALAWTRPAPVRLAEVVLVSALAFHVAGGIRLLLIEFFACHEFQKNLFVISCGFATAAGLLFALNDF